MEASVFVQSENEADLRRDQKERIVFAMIEAGGGHKSPALAVKEALEGICNDKYEIYLADFMKDVGCTGLDEKHKETWNYLLTHPLICKSGHLLADYAGPLFRAGLKVYLLPFYDYVYSFLRTYRPRLIFSTHPFNTIAIDQVRRKYGIKLVLINYLTELFDATSLWVLKGVDYYLVSSKETKEQLILKGVPKNKLYVFDYPLRRDFSHPTASREQIAQGLGIEPSKKTLLISFGGQGRANPARFVDALTETDIPLNVLMVSGRNEGMRKSLSERYKDYQRKLHIKVLGYVDNMHELMHLSDICFIKPGPSTTMEAVSLKKPIIFYQSSQISENANIDFVLKHRVGFYAGDSVKRFLKIIRRCTYGTCTEQIRQNYKHLNIKNGAPDIAHFIVEIMNRK